MFRRVSKNKSLILTTIVSIVLSTIGIALPAQAATPVTSFTATPSTIRSGDYFDFKVNGTQNPDSTEDTFVGCYVYWVNGTPTTGQINGAISLPTSTFFHDNFPNYSATNDTYKFAGWANTSCTGLDLTSTPTWQTALLTVTPQIVIDTISLTAGQEIAESSFAYTEKSSSGSSTAPYNWATGGQFSVAAASSCGLSSNSLPAGVTLNTSTSANTVAPALALQGTVPIGSEGNYQTCVEIEANTVVTSSAYQGSSFAVMNVVVAAPAPAPAPTPAQDSSLAKTGSHSSLFGVVASVLLLSGAALFLLRRRLEN